MVQKCDYTFGRKHWTIN